MVGMNPEDRKAYIQKWTEANREHIRLYREMTKEQRNARRRELYAQDAERRARARADVKRWQTENPDKRKAQRLRKHGVTLMQYQAMLTAQNGKCAICGYADQSAPNFFPVVDHCHESKKVRGLLCMNCNQGLGKFKDDPERLRAAIAYLASHGSSGAA